MKFSVNSKVLNAGLSAVVGAVPTRATLPILETILFEAEEGIIRLTSTDLEITMVETVDAEVEQEGAVAMPAKRLLETLKQLPDTPVRFEVDERANITFRTETGSYRLAGERAEDFPESPDMTVGAAVTCDASVVRKAIQKTLFAVSNDDLRPAMMGVFFNVDGEGSTFVATDGHRLVRYANKGLRSGTPLSFIVPSKALNQIARSLGGESCSITVSDAHAVFETDRTIVATRLINESYPNYESVIPRDNDKQVLIDKDQMLSTVRRVSVFSSTNTRQIRLELDSDKLTIRAEDLDLSSEARETLACEYEGDAMEIGFNARYLADVLQNVETGAARFEFSTPNRAGIVKPEQPGEDEDILMLVMPVMLNTY